MKKSRGMALVILTGLFFFSAAAVNANPLALLKFGTKAVYELGRRAAGEAVERALKEAGGKLPREILEKTAKEALEKTFREVGEKAFKEAFERGAREAEEHLSREVLQEAFGESMEQASRRVMNQALQEVTEETLEHTLGKQLVRGVVRFQDGTRMYISGIVNGAAKFSRNPAEAIPVPFELLKRLVPNVTEPDAFGLVVGTVSAF